MKFIKRNSNEYFFKKKEMSYNIKKELKKQTKKNL